MKNDDDINNKNNDCLQREWAKLNGSLFDTKGKIGSNIT